MEPSPPPPPPPVEPMKEKHIRFIKYLAYFDTLHDFCGARNEYVSKRIIISFAAGMAAAEMKGGVRSSARQKKQTDLFKPPDFRITKTRTGGPPRGQSKKSKPATAATAVRGRSAPRFKPNAAQAAAAVAAKEAMKAAPPLTEDEVIAIHKESSGLPYARFLEDLEETRIPFIVPQFHALINYKAASHKSFEHNVVDFTKKVLSAWGLNVSEETHVYKAVNLETSKGQKIMHKQVSDAFFSNGNGNGVRTMARSSSASSSSASSSSASAMGSSSGTGIPYGYVVDTSAIISDYMVHCNGTRGGRRIGIYNTAASTFDGGSVSSMPCQTDVMNMRMDISKAMGETMSYKSISLAGEAATLTGDDGTAVRIGIKDMTLPPPVAGIPVRPEWATAGIFSVSNYANLVFKLMKNRAESVTFFLSDRVHSLERFILPREAEVPEAEVLEDRTDRLRVIRGIFDLKRSGDWLQIKSCIPLMNAGNKVVFSTIDRPAAAAALAMQMLNGGRIIPTMLSGRNDIDASRTITLFGDKTHPMGRVEVEANIANLRKIALTIGRFREEIADVGNAGSLREAIENLKEVLMFSYYNETTVPYEEERVHSYASLWNSLMCFVNFRYSWLINVCTKADVMGAMLAEANAILGRATVAGVREGARGVRGIINAANADMRELFRKYQLDSAIDSSGRIQFFWDGQVGVLVEDIKILAGLIENIQLDGGSGGVDVVAARARAALGPYELTRKMINTYDKTVGLSAFFDMLERGNGGSGGYFRKDDGSARDQYLNIIDTAVEETNYYTRLLLENNYDVVISRGTIQGLLTAVKDAIAYRKQKQLPISYMQAVSLGTAANKILGETMGLAKTVCAKDVLAASSIAIASATAAKIKTYIKKVHARLEALLPPENTDGKRYQGEAEVIKNIAYKIPKNIDPDMFDIVANYLVHAKMMLDIIDKRLNNMGRPSDTYLIKPDCKRLKLLVSQVKARGTVAAVRGGARGEFDYRDPLVDDALSILTNNVNDRFIIPIILAHFNGIIPMPKLTRQRVRFAADYLTPAEYMGSIYDRGTCIFDANMVDMTDPVLFNSVIEKKESVIVVDVMKYVTLKHMFSMVKSGFEGKLVNLVRASAPGRLQAVARAAVSAPAAVPVAVAVPVPAPPPVSALAPIITKKSRRISSPPQALGRTPIPPETPMGADSKRQRQRS